MEFDASNEETTMTTRKTTKKATTRSKRTTSTSKSTTPRKGTSPKKSAPPAPAEAPRDLPPGWEDATAENDALGARRAPTDAPVTPRDDSQEVVVFAMRLTRAERNLIHAAAGSGKASNFVRGVALAAANGDAKGVQAVIQEAEARRAK
jgi:hypothetical protein